ncbi:zinc finger protein 169-like [Cylas formicarius]|uniref:zinc finger protein 169-like n=1 Tax=Cylas formicarius TaxID=197179 RepID=UPI0029589981|nr:zinc finger protein 169-like [Cylas formicarius]
MNFPPFGGHFSTSVPTIHQFAAKFAQNHEPAPLGIVQECSNRYTANGVPSFTQHHHATQQSPIPTKCNGNYLNSRAMYGSKTPEVTQELCNVLLQNQHDKVDIGEKGKMLEEPRLTSLHHDTQNQQQPWQSSSSVVDYLSQLPTSTLPLTLHHFLKYSAESLKKETVQHLNEPTMMAHNVNIGNGAPLNDGQNSNCPPNSFTNLSTINTAHLHSHPSTTKKKKKKKPDHEKKIKPKPGEIRLTTALDGSTLYCCPECHMAYPEKELLEQHLVGHTLERRFVCDICGAGLKRKDHLTRHKQSHNPERPYVCTVCLKAFKRKEQLTLHFVIHSGEKRHICSECGKGFYRKDHLRKHTRSHIARRVKAELSQQGNGDQNHGLQPVGAVLH